MSPSPNLSPLTLADIAAILCRRRWQIVLTFILVFAAVAVATFAMPKQYSTQMKVLVKNERADMIVSPDRSDFAGYRGQVSEEQINSEIEILTSTNLLRSVAARCKLDSRQHAAFPSEALDKAVDRLSHDLKISPVRKSNVILVEYSDIAPQTAVAVLSNLAELYLEEHLSVHSTPGTYEFFNAQAVRYRQQLTQAEDQLASLRQQDNIVMPDQQKEIALHKSADVDSALRQADASIEEITKKIDNARKQLAATEPRLVTQTRTTSNESSVERLHTMLAELNNRRTQLLAKFRPEDRMVQEVEQEIASTAAALAEAKKLTGLEEATDVNPIYQSLQLELGKQETELAGIQSRRQALAQQSADYDQQLLKLANDSTVFEDLVRNQKEAEENYLLYTKKSEEARIAESLDKQKISNVAIAETPAEPHFPSKPNVKLNLALGGIVAAFLSLGLAFVSEYFRNAVEGPRELEELTGLPVLATSYGD